MSAYLHLVDRSDSISKCCAKGDSKNEFNYNKRSQGLNLSENYSKILKFIEKTEQLTFLWKITHAI